MAYGDLTKTPFFPSTTKTIDKTKTTDIDTDTNNPIEQVNLNALVGVWMYEKTFEEYVGKYHIHQDGTVMIGVGILGESHAIDLNKILIKQTVSKTEGGFEQQSFMFKNLNPIRGDMVVTITVMDEQTTYTVPAEGLELGLFPTTSVKVESVPS